MQCKTHNETMNIVNIYNGMYMHSEEIKISQIHPFTFIVHLLSTTISVDRPQKGNRWPFLELRI
mgnify:CR=1 FL=1